MPLRPKTLDNYVKRARSILIEVAKEKREDRTIPYGQLMDKIQGPSRGYIGQVLEEICQEEYQHNRPLLSALVVHKSDKLPGDAFWKISVVPSHVRNGTKEMKKGFWEEEKRKVYEYWQKHDP